MCRIGESLFEWSDSVLDNPSVRINSPKKVYERLRFCQSSSSIYKNIEEKEVKDPGQNHCEIEIQIEIQIRIPKLESKSKSKLKIPNAHQFSEHWDLSLNLTFNQIHGIIQLFGNLTP